MCEGWGGGLVGGGGVGGGGGCCQCVTRLFWGADGGGDCRGLHTSGDRGYREEVHIPSANSCVIIIIRRLKCYSQGVDTFIFNPLPHRHGGLVVKASAS